jgi:hypothetical protein
MELALQPKQSSLQSCQQGVHSSTRQPSAPDHFSEQQADGGNRKLARPANPLSWQSTHKEAKRQMLLDTSQVRRVHVQMVSNAQT